jgi:DNA-binding SARP family transcriptional activator
LQRAVDLYQGDLLSGRGTRFYEWVDERDDDGLSLRERYRESFYNATKRLADLHIEDRRPDLAVPLLKNVLRFEPTLEDIVRQLYQCYGQLHDLRTLIQEDRNLRQTLQQVYYDPSDPDDESGYYEPDPDTVELFNEIRAELEAEIAIGGIRRK